MAFYARSHTQIKYVEMSWQKSHKTRVNCVNRLIYGRLTSYSNSLEFLISIVCFHVLRYSGDYMDSMLFPTKISMGKSSRVLMLHKTKIQQNIIVKTLIQYCWMTTRWLVYNVLLSPVWVEFLAHVYNVTFAPFTKVHAGTVHTKSMWHLCAGIKIVHTQNTDTDSSTCREHGSFV